MSSDCETVLVPFKFGPQAHPLRTASLQLLDTLPSRPDLSLYSFPAQTIYPPRSSIEESTSSPLPVDAPFSSAHRFSIALPPALDADKSGLVKSTGSSDSLPGSLSLITADLGEVQWLLTLSLNLASGEETTESIRIDGTPQEVERSTPVEHITSHDSQEVREVLEREGVRARLLVDNAAPRLGDLLRLGVEVGPSQPAVAPVDDMSKGRNPPGRLRSLRRIRVELMRRVNTPSSATDPAQASTSSTPQPPDCYLTLLHGSGKSLRYPGLSHSHPPLRLLFTLPTAQLASNPDPSWGEVTSGTPYHSVSFFLRVSIGFGSHDVGMSENRDWIMERDITIRPRLWLEPHQVLIERGAMPVVADEEVDGVDDETLAREAYRQKGRDVVGGSGTYREGEQSPVGLGEASGGHGDPPTFNESEEQARTGSMPIPAEEIMSERLVPVDWSDEDPTTRVGRRGSLGGELGTWVEVSLKSGRDVGTHDQYDGYETFSVAPPSVSASFGAVGPMDPPQEGDEHDRTNVINGMVARLGLSQANGTNDRMQLMEQLGLGEGTRVVDLQDDMPPGIDEPSLPSLPHAGIPRPASYNTRRPAQDVSPPSFAASEAAQAAGGVAAPGAPRAARAARPAAPPPPIRPETHPAVAGDAPPEYFGAGEPGPPGGPPAYS